MLMRLQTWHSLAAAMTTFSLRLLYQVDIVQRGLCTACGAKPRALRHRVRAVQLFCECVTYKVVTV